VRRALHATESGLARLPAATVETLADAGERFDLVLAMEVVEHVADVWPRAAPRW
jgi:2-polyprenyl-6-hydroxyphenyl methylase/3-demethylubiquinone-9 3-methyltransferase